MQKKILLVMPYFQGLDSLVMRELENQNYQVTFVQLPILLSIAEPNRIIRNAKKLLRPSGEKNVKKRFRSIIESSDFDILLAIGGFFTSKKYIDKLKEKTPQIITIVFYWDSFSVWDFSFSIEWFDRSYSFDPFDCRKYKEKELIYLCDFYTEDAPISNHSIYDLCHIGSFSEKHSDRLSIVYELKKAADKNGLQNYFLLVGALPPLIDRKQADKIQILYSFLRYLFIPAYRKYVNEIRKIIKTEYKLISKERLSQEECQYIEKHSKCLIDIPADGQFGYTIRSLNAIVSQQKLITSSPFLKEESFFDENNIFIINKNKPEVDLNFLSSQPHSIKKQNLLNLENWLKKIINN
jgi:hypothetical protein